MPTGSIVTNRSRIELKYYSYSPTQDLYTHTSTPAQDLYTHTSTHTCKKYTNMAGRETSWEEQSGQQQEGEDACGR